MAIAVVTPLTGSADHSAAESSTTTAPPCTIGDLLHELEHGAELDTVLLLIDADAGARSFDDAEDGTDINAMREKYSEEYREEFREAHYKALKEANTARVENLIFKLAGERATPKIVSLFESVIFAQCLDDESTLCCDYVNEYYEIWDAQGSKGEEVAEGPQLRSDLEQLV